MMFKVKCGPLCAPFPVSEFAAETGTANAARTSNNPTNTISFIFMYHLRSMESYDSHETGDYLF
jgi:sarcosine oxidase delta subunit